MRRPPRALIFVLAMACARTAAAQGAQGASNEAAAEALFTEGRALIDAGRVEEGCKKLEASHALDPGTGTLIHLGDCDERLGRTASAWARFRDATSRAARDGRRDWEAVARTRAAELEPKLAKLRVDAPAGVTVRRDGNEIPAAALGSALPIDPGDHVLTASAPGKKPWTTRVSVAASTTSAVAVPVLEDDAAAPLPGAPEGRADARPADGSSLRAVGFAIGAVGLVGLGVGAITGLSAISSNNRSKQACPTDGVCADESARSDNDDARSSATISTIAFVAGGALVAGGVALVVFAPSSSSSPAKTTGASARLRASPQALWLEGTW
jgi:hypothetical protein